MATEQEIARFRRVTALADDDAIYTNAVIDGMIEDLGYEKAVATVWTEKAASVAGLVDTTESGSSRQLSQLRKAYMEMAGSIGGVEEETPTGSGTFVVGIERV